MTAPEELRGPPSDADPPAGLSRRGRLVLLIAGVLGVPLAAFLLLEGGSSLLLFLSAFSSYVEPPQAERRHTRYDPDLGWASVPGLSIADMYGQGVSLHTNQQGFRGSRDTSPRVPDGRLRVICSGDSFTLGYGVDDEHTWCAELEARDARLEPVNMGQGGYGIDQAYLWYRRDGARLEHDVHILAYISHDFRRMQSTSFLGYAKPILTLRDGKLGVDNVPVPRRPFYASWAKRWEAASAPLRASQMIRELRFRFGSEDDEGFDQPRADSATWQITYAALRDLVALNRERNSSLLVVHLPIARDYQGESSRRWRDRARDAAGQLGFTFVDLIEDFRRLPQDSASSMFIHQDVQGFVQARGHYSVAGNRWVAERLYGRLVALPSPSDRLRKLDNLRPGTTTSTKRAGPAPE